MLEMPDDPVAKLEAMLPKDRIQHHIQRNDFPGVNMVSNLPADRTLRVKNADAFADDFGLSLDVLFKRDPLFVLLPNIVWRRGDNELHAAFIQPGDEGTIVLARHVRLCGERCMGYWLREEVSKHGSRACARRALTCSPL